MYRGMLITQFYFFCYTFTCIRYYVFIVYAYRKTSNRSPRLLLEQVRPTSAPACSIRDQASIKIMPTCHIKLFLYLVCARLHRPIGLHYATRVLYLARASIYDVFKRFDHNSVKLAPGGHPVWGGEPASIGDPAEVLRYMLAASV